MKLLLNIFAPTNDIYLFCDLPITVVLQIMAFAVPLQFWRRTLKDFASQDITELAPLSRLLREQVFVDAFNAFLKTEFSSENLYFWLEVDKLMRKYKYLFGSQLNDDETSQVSSSLSASTKPSPQEDESVSQPLLEAAKGSIQIGLQCIGEEAPWQVNLSGSTAANLLASVSGLSMALKNDENLRPPLEATFRCLLLAQNEIYMCLRRDSYVRFLKSPAFEVLHRDDRLRRVLATEKIEVEIQQPTDPEAKTHHSTREESRRTSEHQDELSVSHLPVVEVSTAQATWAKHLNSLTNAARLENESSESSSPAPLEVANVIQSS